MSDKKITELTDGGALQSADELVVARSGANYKIAGSQVVKSGDAAGGDLTGTFPSPTIAAGAVTTAKLASPVTLDAIATAHATAADVAMASHKLTGLSAGTAAGHSVRWEQVVKVDTLSFNVKDYGAVGDGVTNDYTAIAAAITACAAAGGGVVFFPVGTYLIGTQLTVPSGVTLKGVGGPGLRNAANNNWPAPATCTTLKASGALAGMVKFASVTGGGMEDMLLDGNAAATIGILMDVTEMLDFRNVGVKNLAAASTSIGIKMQIATSTVANIGNSWNRFHHIALVAPIGIQMDGNEALLGGTANANSCHNFFDSVFLDYGDGNNQGSPTGGIHLLNCDNNSFSEVFSGKIGAGTNWYAVYFGPTARANYFYHLQPGLEGVYCDTPSVAGTANLVVGYDRENLQAAPTLNTGAALEWWTTGPQGDGIHTKKLNLFSGATSGVVDWNGTLLRGIVGGTAVMQISSTQFTVNGNFNVSGSYEGGNLAMSSHKLTGLGAGTTAGDSVRYEQVLLLAGGTMSGAIAMGANKVTGLAAATANGDAIGWPLPLIGSLKDVQVFAPGLNQTWTKPGTGTVAVVIVKGAGGGGGGGTTGASSINGGAGGGAGGLVVFAVPLGALGSTCNVNVYSGGAGGTAGNVGSNAGGTTAFDSAGGNANVTAATGGGAGGAGTPTGGSGGTATAPTYSGFAVSSSAANGGTGGSTSSFAGSNGATGSGGGGGGINATPTAQAGGTGHTNAPSVTINGAAGAAGVGASAQAGAPGSTNVFSPPQQVFVGGGGGGGATGGSGKNGGTGGDGYAGGGGGGGGSCVTGGTAGAGGKGGNGFVMVLVY